jgi:hypothetical protein
MAMPDASMAMPDASMARLDASMAMPDAGRSRTANGRSGTAEGEPDDDDFSIRPLNLADVVQVRAWLDRVETHITDATAAGEDATRPLARRDLGRRTARRELLEARQSLKRLLQAAKRSVA